MQETFPRPYKAHFVQVVVRVRPQYASLWISRNCPNDSGEYYNPCGRTQQIDTLSLYCQLVTLLCSPIAHDCWSIFSPSRFLQHRKRGLWTVTQCNWKIGISVSEKYAIVFFRVFIGYSEGRHLLPLFVQLIHTNYIK